MIEVVDGVAKLGRGIIIITSGNSKDLKCVVVRATGGKNWEFPIYISYT